jgi:hypothetical protein
VNVPDFLIGHCFTSPDSRGFSYVTRYTYIIFYARVSHDFSPGNQNQIPIDVEFIKPVDALVAEQS